MISQQNKGRLGPLLGGEHGRYYIERYRGGFSSWKEVINKVDPILNSFISFSNTDLLQDYHFAGLTVIPSINLVEVSS